MGVDVKHLRSYLDKIVEMRCNTTKNKIKYNKNLQNIELPNLGCIHFFFTSSKIL